MESNLDIEYIQKFKSYFMPSNETFIKLQSPSCMVVAGSTGSGKTYNTMMICEHCDIMYKEPVLEIQYRYHTWQPLYSKMQSTLSNKSIEFKKGVPTEQEIINFAGNTEEHPHRLLILDDLAQRIVNDKDMCDLFTILSHHKNISCIFIVQNLFTKGRFARDISLQYQYIIFMKSVRSSQQLVTMARQIYQKQKVDFVVKAYNDVCSGKKWGYILLDCAHESEDAYRLRTGIFPGEITIVYKPIN